MRTLFDPLSYLVPPSHGPDENELPPIPITKLPPEYHWEWNSKGGVAGEGRWEPVWGKLERPDNLTEYQKAQLAIAKTAEDREKRKEARQLKIDEANSLVQKAETERQTAKDETAITQADRTFQLALDSYNRLVDNDKLATDRDNRDYEFELKKYGDTSARLAQTDERIANQWEADFALRSNKFGEEVRQQKANYDFEVAKWKTDTERLNDQREKRFEEFQFQNWVSGSPNRNPTWEEWKAKEKPNEKPWWYDLPGGLQMANRQREWWDTQIGRAPSSLFNPQTGQVRLGPGNVMPTTQDIRQASISNMMANPREPLPETPAFFPGQNPNPFRAWNDPTNIQQQYAAGGGFFRGGPTETPEQRQMRELRVQRSFAGQDAARQGLLGEGMALPGNLSAMDKEIAGMESSATKKRAWEEEDIKQREAIPFKIQAARRRPAWQR